MNHIVAHELPKAGEAWAFEYYLIDDSELVVMKGMVSGGIRQPSTQKPGNGQGNVVNQVPHGCEYRQVEHVIRGNRVAQVKSTELPEYTGMVENRLMADISIGHLEEVEGTVVGFLRSDEVHIAIDHPVAI